MPGVTPEGRAVEILTELSDDNASLTLMYVWERGKRLIAAQIRAAEAAAIARTWAEFGSLIDEMIGRSDAKPDAAGERLGVLASEPSFTSLCAGLDAASEGACCRAAVAKEREACARVAETHELTSARCDPSTVADDIAMAILARSTT